MKRIGAMLSAILVIVMMTGVMSFGAENFKIDKTFPEDGTKNTIKDNMCVKVFFSKEVGNDASKKANRNAFKITDSSGKEFPSIIAYDKKNPKYALILVDTTKVKTVGKGKYVLQDDTEYTCTISKDFVDNNGNSLGKDEKITFKTINQSRNTMIYMVMMALLFGGMIIFSIRQSRKSHEEEGKEKEAAFNPYKEAKKTGKSVEEVMAKHEKEVARKKANKIQLPAEEEEKNNTSVYKVSGPRPISAAGSTYKTGRKAIAEAKKAAEEERKRELKANNYAKAPKKAKATTRKSSGKSKRRR